MSSFAVGELYYQESYCEITVHYYVGFTFPPLTALQRQRGRNVSASTHKMSRVNRRFLVTVVCPSFRTAAAS